MRNDALLGVACLLSTGCPEPDPVPSPNAIAMDCIEVGADPILLAEVDLVESYDELGGPRTVAGPPIVNTCDVAVNIGASGLDIVSGPAVNPATGAPVLQVPLGAQRVPARSTVALGLTYDPVVQGMTRAVLDVGVMGAPDVELTAIAREARIGVGEPDRAEHVVGCLASIDVPIESEGEAPLTLREITLHSPIQPVTLVDGPELPLTLQPGEGTRVTLEYLPDRVGRSVPDLVVDSDAWHLPSNARPTRFPIELQAQEGEEGAPCP